MTKKYRNLFLIFGFLSILLNIAPISYYVIAGLIQSTLVVQKVALTMTVFVVLILSIVSWVNKITLRSKLWILLIGFYIALQNILTPLILIAICQVLDELIVAPLYRRYKSKYSVNKEIDKRL